ncbi:MAG: cytochrome c family protein [Candidatus Desantisbacteria bacterium]
MLKKWALGIMVIGLAAGWFTIGSSEEKGGKKEERKNVGSKKCQNCHDERYMDWQKSKMAKSFDLLKAGVRAETKANKHYVKDGVKIKIDPQKDYTKEDFCLQCHTTGYDEKGGFIPVKKLSKIADKALLKKAEERNKSMEGNGCENCHGAGSEYTEIMQKIKDAKKAEPDAEKKLVAAGLILPGRTDVVSNKSKLVCLNCHNEKSPMYKEFVPGERLGGADKSFHKHYKLKYIEHVYPVVIEPKKAEAKK